MLTQNRLEMTETHFYPRLLELFMLIIEEVRING